MTQNVHKNNANNSEQELCRFLVPTKQYDDRPTKRIKTTEAERTKKSYDAFLYYSLKENRMNALLGDDTDILKLSSNSLMSTDTVSTGTVERSSRISFEVHPSLMFDERLTQYMGIGIVKEDEDHFF
mmetsp:Transcript_22780/g.45483  ORF Transcript_22780/g.45483 Transcript_22780/m.45483 type:complete len:127 (+) Transcript_22780:114-494(+)